MLEIIDWQQPPRRPRRLFFLALAILAVVIFGSRTALSYYVDALWFRSLGYGDVFRKTLTLQWAVFAVFFALTFLFLYGWFLALRWAYQSDLPDDYMIVIGGQRLKLPVARILRHLGLAVSLVVAVVTGASVMMQWPTFALYWYAPRTTGGAVDPIFGKPVNFYLFTLPAWQSITGWLLTLAVIAAVIAVFFVFVTGSTRMLSGRRGRYISLPWRGFSIAFGFLLLILAMRAYIARFERLFDEHTCPSPKLCPISIPTNIEHCHSRQIALAAAHGRYHQTIGRCDTPALPHSSEPPARKSGASAATRGA